MLTAIGLIVVACALAGCGRKSNLDLPPSAASLQQAPSAVEETNAAAAQGNLYEPGSGGEKPLVAPQGTKKRIILDSLLD